MKKETAKSSELLLDATQKDIILHRNNVGACESADGRYIQYGVGIGIPGQRPSDFIGFTRVTITPDMVGKTVAIFTAVEAKKEGWGKPTNKREREQKAFIDSVNREGGIAYFSTGRALTFDEHVNYTLESSNTKE